MDLDMSLRGAQRRSNLKPTGERLLCSARNDREAVFILVEGSSDPEHVLGHVFADLGGVILLQRGLTARVDLIEGGEDAGLGQKQDGEAATFVMGLRYLFKRSRKQDSGRACSSSCDRAASRRL